MIDLYFLIPAVTAQIFNPTAELAIPTGTSAYETLKTRKKKKQQENAQSNLKPYKFLRFLLIKLLCFISSKR